MSGFVIKPITKDTSSLLINRLLNDPNVTDEEFHDIIDVIETPGNVYIAMTASDNQLAGYMKRTPGKIPTNQNAIVISHVFWNYEHSDCKNLMMDYALKYFR